MSLVATKKIVVPLATFYEKICSSIFSQMMLTYQAGSSFLSCIPKDSYLKVKNLSSSFKVYYCHAVKAKSFQRDSVMYSKIFFLNFNRLTFKGAICL